MPEGMAPVRPVASDDPATRALLLPCCDIPVRAQAELNVLDARIGDDDTGSTLAGAPEP